MIGWTRRWWNGTKRANQATVSGRSRPPRSSARRDKRLEVESLERRTLMCGNGVIGDANFDGAFNETDIVQVFQVGKYETGAQASWSEGDWNCDGQFDSADIVTAFRGGRYRQPAVSTSQPTLLSPRLVHDTNDFAQMPAFSMLVPNDWSLQSNIRYNPIPSLTRSGWAYAQSPDGSTGVEIVVSDTMNAWVDNPILPIQAGQLYFGSPLFPPVDGSTYFQQSILPNLRSNYNDYQIVSIQREPNLINALNRRNAIFEQMLNTIGGTAQFDAISVNATFTVNGKRVDEVIHAHFQYTSVPTGPSTIINWGMTGFERIFAPRNEFQAMAPVLKTIARSPQVNPQWFITIENFRADIHNITRQGQQAWNNYNRVQTELSNRRDEIFQDFVYYIRGTDVVTNPHTGTSVELPSDGNIWFGSGGDVLITQDAGLNPNLVSEFSGSWLAAA